MDTTRYEHFVEVAGKDIDELGHVNNAVYLRYAEDCGRRHSDGLGLTLERFRELGVLPVVRRHEIEYLRPALPGDRLRVTTEVVRLGGPRAQRRTRVFRAATDELLADILTDWVWLEAASLRPVRAPAAVVAGFGG